MYLFLEDFLIAWSRHATLNVCVWRRSTPLCAGLMVSFTTHLVTPGASADHSLWAPTISTASVPASIQQPICLIKLSLKVILMAVNYILK